MKMINGWRLIALFLVSPMFGCANSGIVQIGPSTYMLAKSEWGFTSGAIHTARLMQDASEFCYAKGMRAILLSSSSNDVQLGKTPAAEIRFQCTDYSASSQSKVNTPSYQEIESQKLSPAQTQVDYQKKLHAHALVIGNGAYFGSSRLSNPINDGKAMSVVLRRLGFTVTELLDADRTKLVTALSQFSKTAASADITLLFYAGHGVQISGTNYMLPIDLNMNDLSQVPLQGVSLSSVVEQYLPGKTKLVFLDACRDNPLMQTASRSVSRGLAPINVSEGTLISYSTKDGQVAQDGEGKNSPFTKALLDHLDDPEDIAVVLRKVREQVMRNTGGKQQPWEYGSLTGGSLVLSAIKQK